MSRIDLSVVIACYNIGDYLTECLDSLVDTQFPHNRVEILAVDDGSTDHITPQIIDEYARRYPFIKALHKSNGGLSDARNYGMDRAHGRYIAFVDGDDVVPADAYPDLMYTAERYHSKIVTGFVYRFDEFKHYRSSLHKFAVQDNVYQTTIRQTHSLLYDTTAWNKVWNLDFLRHNKLRFIKGILYEDIPFSLAAQLKSDNSSIITTPVYWWRTRANSITNSRGDISNFVSRISSLNRCRRELLQAGFGPSSSLYLDFIRKILHVDLPVFLQNCGDTEPGYVYQIQEITYRFLRDWHLLHSPLLQQQPLKYQILYYAIRTGDLHLLQQYSYVRYKNLVRFHLSHIIKHYQLEIPGLSSKVLRHLNYKHNVLVDTQSMDKLQIDPENYLIWGSGMFRIRHAQLFKHHLNNNNYRERIAAQLVNVTNQKSMPIYFHRQRTDLYKRIFHPKTRWTNSRYYFSFYYNQALQELGNGLWRIKVHDVLDGKYSVADYLGSPRRMTQKLFPPLNCHHYSILDRFNTRWQLEFIVRSDHNLKEIDDNWIGNPTIKHGQLCFTVNLIDHDILPVIQFNTHHRLKGHLIRQKNNDQIVFPLSAWSLKSLQGLHSLQLIDKKTNHIIAYRFNSGHPFNKLFVGSDRQVTIFYDNRNAIQVSYRYRQLVIQNWHWVHDKGGRAIQIQARLHTSYQYHPTPFNYLKVEMLSNNLKNRYLLTAKKNQLSFNHHVLTLRIPMLNYDDKQLLTLEGQYHFVIYLPASHNRVIKTGLILPSKLVMEKFRSVPIKTSDTVLYQLIGNPLGNLECNIEQPWNGLDRFKAYRALSYSILYPLMRFLPIRKNVMVFDSYWASQYSSNERAIYRYIRNHYPKIKTVWMFHNRQTPIDGNGKRIRVNSLRYWYYMATAKYLLQNTNLPDQYFKRAGQIEVETLHGTFLKHMGFDEPFFRNINHQDNFIRRIRRWDYMIVPSNYMKKIASHAFDYHQEILSTGFPRNDELVYHNNLTYINTIKRRLNIPLNKKVVLYAPTFRKQDGFNFNLDLDRLEKALSPDYVLLVRLHYFVAHAGNFHSNPGFVYDVSDYSNINDLYLVSDVLVTDYSSVMFDYARLERPMIFYAYDRKWYLNNHNRGIYLDYDKTMPGPIVEKESALIYDLLHLHQIQDHYQQAIINFSKRFAQFGRKGDATRQTVEAILHPRHRQLDQIPDQHVIFHKFCHIFHIDDFQMVLLNYLSRYLPKKNTIIFDSFSGTQYSDSPKAIYLYIKKHDPQYKCYWNVNAEQVPFFKRHGIPYVKQSGYRDLLKKATAKAWVINTYQKFCQIPRHGVKVLQTWHGTPLKRIGADIDKILVPGEKPKKYHKRIYNFDKHWNYLLVPNRYSLRIMPRAFRKQANQLMLTGSPKDDLLVNHNNLQTISSIKRRLGIDPHKKVILYAPTIRDTDLVKDGKYAARLHLNLAKLSRHYGQQIVLLVRSHHLIANRWDLSGYHNFAINVSDYPDVADLYLISDVLITDYSSAMFDYAILRRPIIFFDYNLKHLVEHYSDFYPDLKKIIPGSMVSTTDQIITKLDSILAGHWRMSDKYRHFIKKFTSWDDGKASARAVQQLLNKNNVRNCYLSRRQLSLPEKVHVKDGALMWKFNDDSKELSDAHVGHNYDNDNQAFRVLKGIQLESTSFNEKMGMKYVLIKNQHDQAWISYDDVI